MPCPALVHAAHSTQATYLTLFPSLPAATLAGRLYSGRSNSSSREDSKGRATHRLERCEVRGVGVEEGGPVSSAHRCQQHRMRVSLLDWYLTDRGPPACVWGTPGLYFRPLAICPPLQTLSLPRPSPQSQPVYTAPKFMSVSHCHPC